jgi:hypothetical protein
MSIFLHQLKLLNVTDQDRVANSFWMQLVGTE